MMRTGGIDGGMGGETDRIFLENEWSELLCSARQKLPDAFGKWGKLGTATRMRDSEAWISGLAIVKTLANRLTRSVSSRDRTQSLQKPSPCLISLQSSSTPIVCSIDFAHCQDYGYVIFEWSVVLISYY